MIAWQPQSVQPLRRLTWGQRLQQRRRAHRLVHPGWVYRLPADELLSELSPDCAGAVIIHPPPDIGKGASQAMATVDEQISALVQVAEHTYRVLKPGGACLAIGDTQLLAAWAVAAEWAGLSYLGDIGVIWNRSAVRRPHAVANLPSLFTTVARWVKPGYRSAFNPRSLYSAQSNVLICQPVPEHARASWDQLPVELCNYLISMFTDYGDLVVDPMCGTGSTLVAAELNDRPWAAGDVLLDKCVRARHRIGTAELEELREIGYWVNGKIEWIEG